MIITKTIDGKNYDCSTSATDFFLGDKVKQYNLCSCLEMMHDCLDYLYDLAVQYYPKVFKPVIYIATSDVVNAFACRGEIIVTTNLIFQAAELIQKRYSKELLDKYALLEGTPHSEVLACIRVYFWRYIVLHELYHLWHGHATWRAKYTVDKAGMVVARMCGKEIGAFSESEFAARNRHAGSKGNEQSILTAQALELDADASAVCMLINLLMRDTEARQVHDKAEYVKKQVALIGGALSTAFCLLDGNSGARFDVLNTLMHYSHPLPSLRMFYAEEIVDAMLSHYYPDNFERSNIESEWQKLVCDLEPDQNGKVDMGQVFYYTAYTEKAQKHLCRLKRRMYDIYDTLSECAIGNIAPKLNEDEISFCSSAVWFADDGASLRGWVNPATGEKSAIKAKPAPFLSHEKIGRNDPCPCGSGDKYKKCTCTQYHPQSEKYES